MKKLAVWLVVLCLLTLCALAEMDEDGDVVVTLDGAEFFFTPIVGHCITQESSASVFTRAGFSQRELLPWMEQNGVYALMYDETGAVEIQVVAHPSAETDFDEMNEFGETMMCEELAYSYTDHGYDVTSTEIYLAPEGHKFVRISAAYTEADGGLIHMVDYFTCQAGYGVSVCLFHNGGEATEAQLLMCEEVADSLWITATE